MERIIHLDGTELKCELKEMVRGSVFVGDKCIGLVEAFNTA